MNNIRVLESENSQVKWVDLEDTYNEDAVDWIRPVNEKIVKKVRVLKRMVIYIYEIFKYCTR